MKVKVHLISAPWANPARPSIQTSTLKSYVKQIFSGLEAGQVECRTYSAHLKIPHAVLQSQIFGLIQELNLYGEYPYLYLIYQRFIRPNLKAKERSSLEKIISEMNHRARGEPRNKMKLSRALLNKLGRATDAYLNRELIPELIADGVNVVGFTLNFWQLYASLYVQKYLMKKAPRMKMVFLYGGYCASSPLGISMLQKMEGSGYRVIGEGEKKLELVIKALLAATDTVPKLEVDGVVPIEKQVDLFEKPEKYYRSQFADISQLPNPDYSEYFSSVARINKTDPVFNLFKKYSLPVEGSRGCFAHCDFCTLNSQWQGFRKIPAEAVFLKTKDALERYGVRHVMFTDNVCDTWAEKFADLVVESGLKFNFFMELRAHHPQRFWAKLARAGMSSAQIGVEALSEPLLKGIGKGTRVIQNLAVLKYLQELGVHSNSNVISGHPKATVADVIETRRVLEQIPHFGALTVNHFWLDAGSPLFDQLAPAEKIAAKPLFVRRLPGALRDVICHFCFEVPERIQATPEALEAGQALKEWFNGPHAHAMRKTEPKMTMTRLDDGQLEIVDTRFGNNVTRLEGTRARIYDACHSGPRIESLVRQGFQEDALRVDLQWLLERQLLLETGGHYLSLALRPKRELMAEIAESEEVLAALSKPRDGRPVMVL